MPVARSGGFALCSKEKTTLKGLRSHWENALGCVEGRSALMRTESVPIRATLVVSSAISNGFMSKCIFWNGKEPLDFEQTTFILRNRTQNLFTFLYLFKFHQLKQTKNRLESSRANKQCRDSWIISSPHLLTNQKYKQKPGTFMLRIHTSEWYICARSRSRMWFCVIVRRQSESRPCIIYYSCVAVTRSLAPEQSGTSSKLNIV